MNNAGGGALGLFEGADPQRARRLMELNFFSLVEMTRSALPLLKLGRQPIVVNISSILGHRGIPHMSEYSATQVRGAGVQRVDPGGVHPLGHRRAGGQPRHDRDRVLRPGHRAHGQPNWPKHRPVSAAGVARQIVRAIRQGRHEIIPYRWGRVLCLAQPALAAAGRLAD